MLSIKDLKALSVFFVGGSIDMQDLKDLKRCFHVKVRGGQAPALRFSRPSPFHRRARACPSPCLGLGKGFGLRAFFARVVGSRGTGPRATVKKRAVYRRARACPSPCHRFGKGFGLRAFFARVVESRGTGPRATVSVRVLSDFPFPLH